jgi:hypothetical protein|tara:strand:+ start:263 stop:679 length:417 start_codon:yes stop_codon:yes gene_type:complete
MSQLKCDTITNRAGTSGPNFSQGALVTGNLQVTGSYLDNSGTDVFANLEQDRLINGSVQAILSTSALYPNNNNSYDLGTNSNRWRDVYTNDLNLSNEGSSNSIDGSWGSYTIQEGENDLFLINNRSGKKYKFNLTEVN